MLNTEIVSSYKHRRIICIADTRYFHCTDTSFSLYRQVFFFSSSSTSSSSFSFSFDTRFHCVGTQASGVQACHSFVYNLFFFPVIYLQTTMAFYASWCSQKPLTLTDPRGPARPSHVISWTDWSQSSQPISTWWAERDLSWRRHSVCRRHR